MENPKEFKINRYLHLKLKHEQTHLYVDGEPFRQCKYLFLSVPLKNTEEYRNINSIDEAAENLDRSLEGNHNSEHKTISPQTEFWGHCSNLQAWAENNYDTRLLHSNLAFPLLKKLTEAGDPRAKRVFKEEVARRLQENVPTVKNYLIEQGYLNYLSGDELDAIQFDWVEWEKEKIILDSDTLDLSHLGIADLSQVSNIFDLNSLEHLDLGWNRLTTLPEPINQLRSLITINLAYNKIQNLPKSISDIKQLKMVNLAYNVLREFPKALEWVKSLRVLDLRANNFKDVPEAITNLSWIDTLNLSKNRIEQLPASIGKLKSLKELYLHQNQLQSLPSSMKKLETLKVLHLGRNNFERVPEVIFTLPNLSYLNIWFNPLNEEEYDKLDRLKAKGIEVRSLHDRYQTI
jgi:internalin A